MKKASTSSYLLVTTLSSKFKVETFLRALHIWSPWERDNCETLQTVAMIYTFALYDNLKTSLRYMINIKDRASAAEAKDCLTLFPGGIKTRNNFQ